MGTTEERDANLRARKIEAYWAGLGYKSVACVVERVTDSDGGPQFAVRCNLKNGLPVDFQREDLRRLERGR